jgi:hypothetical protein
VRRAEGDDEEMGGVEVVIWGVNWVLCGCLTVWVD